MEIGYKFINGLVLGIEAATVQTLDTFELVPAIVFDLFLVRIAIIFTKGKRDK